ncbi:MAG: VCBS repeat-containing protein [Planctomycetes bacterium]|nr:VCBS repeat-containing protein [Planctomycetota bacterium]
MSPSRLALVGLACLAFVPCAVAGELDFAPSSFLAGSQPNSVSLGDYDGDSIPDLAVADGNTATVKLWKGVGDGTFTADGTLPAASQTLAVLLVDLDGDSDLDVLAGSSNADITIHRGDGAGGFTAGPIFKAALSGSPPDPIDFAVVDVSGDGLVDICCANWQANSISVHRALANGTYAPPITLLYPGILLRTICAGDFDEDGDIDLATGGLGTLVRMVDNQGAGVFADKGGISGYTGWLARAADFDGDGHLDLLVSSIPTNGVAVARGHGDGTFDAPFTIPAGYQPLGMVVEDLDGDGDLDVAATTSLSNRIAIVTNDGAGGGTLASAWTNTGDAYTIDAADLDGDGLADLVSNEFDTDSCTVLMNLGEGPWTNTGAVLGQASGLHAALTGSGPLTAGSTNVLDLAFARSATSAVFVLGLSLLDAPFKGGVLVPNPDLIVAGLPLDAQKNLIFPFAWPAGVPAGTPFWIQEWFTDASNPLGFAASNGLRGEAQ